MKLKEKSKTGPFLSVLFLSKNFFIYQFQSVEITEILSLRSLWLRDLEYLLVCLQEINREEVTKYEEGALLLSCSAVCFVGLC